MTDPDPTIDPELLRETYRAILELGMENLQRYRIPERIDYLAAEIDHLHNLPRTMRQESVLVHSYYYCATRPLYLERMARIEVIDTEFIIKRYQPHWQKLREGLLPFAEVINSKYQANPHIEKLE